MKKFFNPTLYLSLGLVSLTISINLFAFVFGIIPNQDGLRTGARQAITDSIVAQIAVLINRHDLEAVRDTINIVVGTESGIQSIVVIDTTKGKIEAAAYRKVSQQPKSSGQIVPKLISAPIVINGKTIARVDVQFKERVSKQYWGLPVEIIRLLVFTATVGLAGFYIIIWRCVKILDPGRSIPARVKAAFDTLAEGVLILDGKGFVLMANDAFLGAIQQNQLSLLGSQIDDLNLVMVDHPGIARDCPWTIAMRTKRPSVGTEMQLINEGFTPIKFVVNATCIEDTASNLVGVVVTFNDVTALHIANENLISSNKQLTLSQIKIEEQNERLIKLASRDPLTDCLNRRAFFEKFESNKIAEQNYNSSISLMMLDADHFKSINDRYGHGVGDKVLIGIVDLCKSKCTDGEIIGRYGGEEFCIGILNRSEREAEELAENIRIAIASSNSWLPDSGRVTISIGLASVSRSTSFNIADLVRQADQALYKAKESGRNRVVNWNRHLQASTD